MDAVLNHGDLCTESVFAAQAGLQSLLYFFFLLGAELWASSSRKMKSSPPVPHNLTMSGSGIVGKRSEDGLGKPQNQCDWQL